MAGITVNTKLMLFGDVEPWVDSSSSAHTITEGGTVTADTTAGRKPFGTASALFATGGLSAGASADFNFGASTEYSIDFWIYAVGSGEQMIISAGDSLPYLEIQAGSRQLQWRSDAGLWNTTVNLSGSTLHHVAIIRRDVASTYTIHVFLDGVHSASQVNATAYDFSNELKLGRWYNDTLAFDGNISNFRWTQGESVIDTASDPLYISSGDPTDGFTPPSAPYSAAAVAGYVPPRRSRSAAAIQVPPPILLW